MNVHKNAPLTPKGREAMVRSVVEGGLGQADAAYQFNTTAKTVAKWVKRFRAEGVEGLRDRSSRPLSSPSQTPPATCAAIEALRRQRHTGKQIAAEVEVSPATVSRVLRRLGLNRMRDLEPAEPERRYERESPGEILHIEALRYRLWELTHQVARRLRRSVRSCRYSPMLSNHSTVSATAPPGANTHSREEARCRRRQVQSGRSGWSLFSSSVRAIR